MEEDVEDVEDVEDAEYVEESAPSPASIVEPVHPEPIEVPPAMEGFELRAPTPLQELELDEEEVLPTDLTPSDIVPPTPTPITEETRSPSPVSDSQLFHSISFNPSPPPATPKSEEEQDANVDIINISDDEEVQSLDSHIDNIPRTPSPTIFTTIDTSLLHRGPDQPMIVAPPSPIHDPQYNFDEEFSFDPVNPSDGDGLPFHLPLLSSLPPEFRKKTTRTQRKREKERERTDVRKEKEEWTPMGMARWRALLRANPTWQHLAKSTKSLTTRDWTVSLCHVHGTSRFSTPIRLH